MGKKILIAEDNIDERETLKSILEENNFSVIEVGNGEDLIKKVEKENPQLIIADVIMPKLNGISAIQKLSENPKTENIPIIVCSAKGRMGELLKIFSLKNVCFFEKPYNPEELIKKINEILK